MADVAKSNPKPPSFNARFRRWIVWTLRVVVGATFVLSGFVKMVDIWGFIFKIEDYLAVWHLSQPRSLVLVAAILIAGFEFVMGFQLITGSYKRSAPWLLTAMMAFMLPLSAYLWIKNPVDDCGCFGEFVHLSNGATFGKNVALMAALIYLCVNNPKVRWGFFKPAVQWIESLIFSLYIITIGLYGFNVQPLLDFRPFPVGTELVNDSDYSLAIDDGDEEVTDEVIEPEGDQLLLVLTEPRRADIAFTYAINEINDFANDAGVPLICLISAEGGGVDRWLDLSMANYPVYTVDDTSLKQLARGVMALVKLHDGRVEWKRTVNSISVDTVDEGIANGDLITRLAINYDRIFKRITIFFLVLLGILFVFQGTVIAINYAVRAAIRRLKEQKSA